MSNKSLGLDSARLQPSDRPPLFAFGSFTVTVVPCPSADAIVISPPCASMMPFAIDRPRPAPGVAALCAFNFPLAGIAQKIAPAIVAGCTAVVKTPDPDPLALFAMADLVTEAGFPPGVINIVAATRDASAHLVGHQLQQIGHP